MSRCGGKGRRERTIVHTLADSLQHLDIDRRRAPVVAVVFVLGVAEDTLRTLLAREF